LQAWPRSQTRFIDRLTGDVAANLFGLSCDFDHKPDRRSSLPMGGAPGPIGQTESGSETKMTTHLPRFAIALMVLSMGSLYYGLYSKSQHLSGCRAQFAQLQLIEAQLDTTEAALNAAELQLHGVKR
jgi:hypothetical protein